MGAQPKRKITRSMQGARRKGNTPKLVKDHTYSSVPLHKRGLFDKFMALFSADAAKAAPEETKKEKAKPAAQAAGTSAQMAQPKASAKVSAPVKKTTRTQHKGG